MQAEIDATTESDGAPAGNRTRRSGRICSARLVEIYKLGRGRYLRLLLATSDLRAHRSGDARRRRAGEARSRSHRVASADARASSTPRARRSTARRTKLEAVRADAARAQAAAARADAGAQRSDPRHRHAARPERAARRASCRPRSRSCRLTLRGVGAGSAPVEAGSAAAASVPRRPRLAGGRQRQPPLRATASAAPRVKRHRDRRERRRAGPAVHEGVVAFAGHVRRIRQSRHRRPRAQTFSLYGESARYRRSKRARGSTAASRSARVGLSPSGPAGLYFELRVDGQPVDPLQWLKKNGEAL